MPFGKLLLKTESSQIKKMIHLQFIHLVKSESDLINVILGIILAKDIGGIVPTFAESISTCVRQVLNYFFFVKIYHILLTMKVHQVHHLQKHMECMFIILYECQTFVNSSQ